MTEPAIQIRDVQKEFKLRHSGYGSLKSLVVWSKAREKSSVELLHVLKGISFDVNPGECVAVVGRNGAGKSTLLSLLARVYKPTSGTITMHGRVAPLLELGAGFHPDLTGLENVMFNGVVLGLKREEIARRIPQIVEFAGVERHIDAPVRTFSSGMIARLGFAIAVHVDADILIVDEVLAVGDFDFERKCYQKIAEFKANGGTILFVSHDMHAVETVADRCVWLHNGLVREIGPPDVVIPNYYAAG